MEKGIHQWLHIEQIGLLENETGANKDAEKVLGWEDEAGF